MDVDLATRNAKHRKLIEEQNTSRLGSLPNNILNLILSSLPTKDAVKTSILSKRWRFLWMSIHNLDFKEWDSDEPDLDIDEEEDEESRTLFTNFVERVILLRDASNIKKFSLTCDVMLDASRVNSWVFAALRRNVEVLKLKLDNFEEPFELPRCLFSCESLRVLEVDMDYDLKLPSAIRLSNLKTLKLKDVKFLDGHKTQQFFSNCPLLENLRLIDCNWGNVKAVCISGPRLKKVSISDIDKTNCLISDRVDQGNEADDQDADHEDCQDQDEGNEADDQHADHEDGNDPDGGDVEDDQDADRQDGDDQDGSAVDQNKLNGNQDQDDDVVDQNYLNCCQVVIFGKSIRQFDYVGDLINDFCLYNSSPLVYASLHAHRRSREAAFRGHKLLRDLSSAKTLTLQPVTFEVLSYAEEFFAHLPLFHNLNHLVIMSEPYDFASGALLSLLQSSPNLNHLEFTSGICLSSDTEKDDVILDPVPPCFLSHLDNIEVHKFEGNEEELRAVKILLKNATVLDKFVIFHYEDHTWNLEKQKKLREHLLDLPRGSESCEVVFK